MRPVAVHALWLAQDDPKKNTAVLASKRGNLTLHKSIRSIPKRGIILEPLCGKVFGPEDHELLLERGGALVHWRFGSGSLCVRVFTLQEDEG